MKRVLPLLIAFLLGSVLTYAYSKYYNYIDYRALEIAAVSGENRLMAKLLWEYAESCEIDEFNENLIGLEFPLQENEQALKEIKMFPFSNIEHFVSEIQYRENFAKEMLVNSKQQISQCENI